MKTSIKILLIATLVIFPLGTLARFQISDDLFIQPIDLLSTLILLIVCIMFASSNKFRQKVTNHPFSKALSLFLITLVAPLAINIFFYNTYETLIALSYFVRFASYTSLIYAFLLVDKKFTKPFFYLLSVSGLTTVVLGLVQFKFYKYLGNLFYLGWDEHLNRLFGTHLDPNFTGTIFALEIGILIFLASKVKSRKKALMYLCMFVTFLALILTYSRTAYIGLLVSSIGLLKSISVKKIVISFAVISLIFIGILIKNKNAEEGLNLLRTASVNARLSTYIQATTIFSDNPIFGTGYNTLQFVQREYGYKTLQSPIPDNAASGIPNSYLVVLVTSGVVGFAAFLYLTYTMFMYIVKKVKDKNIQYLAVSSLLIVYTTSLVENVFFYNFTMFWLFSILGIVIKINTKENK